MRTIRVTVKPDGSSKVDAENFQGQGCAAATEAIAIAITGADRDRKDDDTKPEFWNENSQDNFLQ